MHRYYSIMSSSKTRKYTSSSPNKEKTSCYVGNNVYIAPCCNTKSDGKDCHFKEYIKTSDTHMKQMRADYLTYKKLEKDIDQMTIKNPEQDKLLDLTKLAMKKRSQWLKKYYRESCYLCDGNLKNHQGKVEKMKQILKKKGVDSLSSSRGSKNSRKRKSAHSKSDSEEDDGFITVKALKKKTKFNVTKKVTKKK